jgi:hypothetical protein
MKKVTNNYKMMAIALVTVITLGFTGSAFAGNNNETPVKLTFVGKLENRPVFQLELNNNNADDLVITVNDADGNILLFEKLKGEKISRKYQLDTEDAELIGGTTFKVTNRNTNSSQVYKITNAAKTVQNIEIAKL